mmetsp:Transcript_12993/g.43188  ORF Transcript_12993/g.43188 Transcript_12993/m.43188 type:complete len:236 (-) Transcript_12993:472-1179(-)
MTLEGEGIPCCAFGKVKASSYSSSSPSANSKVGGVDGTSQGMLSPSSARASSPGPPSVSRRASIARRMWAGGGAISPPRRKTIRMTHSASTVGAGSAVGLSSGEPSSSPPSSAVTIRCSTSKMMPLQLDVSALTHCTRSPSTGAPSSLSPRSRHTTTATPSLCSDLSADCPPMMAVRCRSKRSKAHEGCSRPPYPIASGCTRTHSSRWRDVASGSQRANCGVGVRFSRRHAISGR